MHRKGKVWAINSWDTFAKTDAIAHVVRCFDDENVAHVHDRVDPVSDLETITTELILADLETVGRTKIKLERIAKSGNKEALVQLGVCEHLKRHLEGERLAREFEVDDEQAHFLGTLHLLTDKPMFYVANVAEDGFEDNPHLTRLQAHAARQSKQVVPICAKIEAELAQLGDADQQEYLRDLGLDEPGLHRVIRTGYTVLGLQTFFSAGPKEARAWTVQTGTTAPQAAGKIHTDFEKGFYPR